MDITDSSIGVFHISRLLGLAPYSVRKTAKGQLDIRRSWIFSIYSLLLSSIMVILTYRGVILDAHSKIPVRSFQSATSKVVTGLDVTVVVLAILAGVSCGLLGNRATRELNQRLRKVDSILNQYNDLRRDRWRSMGIAIISLAIISLLLVLDVWARLKLAVGVAADTVTIELNVHWYIPFYSLYLILTGLHVSFTNTAYGLGRRYRRLNQLLKDSFGNELNRSTGGKSLKAASVMTISVPSSPIKLNDDEAVANEEAKARGILINSLADNHESLGKCVRLLSNAYGVAVLFILVSCLLHLVATSYFLFLQLLDNKKNSIYMWVQVLWIIFHTCRLLMVVEPCHLTACESHRTIQIVCEIERRLQDPVLIEAMKKFWQQLLVGDAEFSASGLCRVNRTILTSFASAIATYLVILIQFQKTNG